MKSFLTISAWRVNLDISLNIIVSPFCNIFSSLLQDDLLNVPPVVSSLKLNKYSMLLSFAYVFKLFSCLLKLCLSLFSLVEILM